MLLLLLQEGRQTKAMPTPAQLLPRQPASAAAAAVV
jgi:hypothetical protein